MDKIKLELMLSGLAIILNMITFIITGSVVWLCVSVCFIPMFSRNFKKFKKLNNE